MLYFHYYYYYYYTTTTVTTSMTTITQFLICKNSMYSAVVSQAKLSPCLEPKIEVVLRNTPKKEVTIHGWVS